MPIERITLVRFRTSDGMFYDDEVDALLHERCIEIEPSLAVFIRHQSDPDQPRLPTTIRRYVLAWEEWRVREAFHAKDLDEEEPPPLLEPAPGGPYGDCPEVGECERGTTEAQP